MLEFVDDRPEPGEGARFGFGQDDLGRRLGARDARPFERADALLQGSSGPRQVALDLMAQRPTSSRRDVDARSTMLAMVVSTSSDTANGSERARSSASAMARRAAARSFGRRAESASAASSSSETVASSAPSRGTVTVHTAATSLTNAVTES